MTNAQEWDERYADSERLWSGEPNGALVRIASELPPGRALDVGCGEGADSGWLAAQGWQVSALDISAVAVDRAKAAVAAELGVRWIVGDVAGGLPADAAFELVSACYFPLHRGDEGTAALRRLLSTVVPGGTLCWVGHDLTHASAEHLERHKPEQYFSPEQVAEHLGHDWTVQTLAVLPRDPAPADNPFVDDVVLRATRN